MVSQYDQTLPGPETPGWSQLPPATALMENTTLEEEERTFGLDIIPLILASALALILGQNCPVKLIMESYNLLFNFILRIHFK